MQKHKNIKDILFIISIVYSIIIIILSICSYFTSTNIVDLEDQDKNIKLVNEYRNSLNNINEGECKNTVKDLIDYYENTSYNGQVNLQENVLNNQGLLNYAKEIFDNCNLNDEIKEKVGLKILTASIQFDEVILPLYFQYEIRIPDLQNRLLLEPNLLNIKYKINRKTQLEIIKILIDIMEGEKNE